MSLLQTNFTMVDWAIVGIYLLSSIAIGIWANRFVGSLSDYLVAGRTLRIRLALATMTGTELGLVTVMYSSELGFTQQYASLYLAIIEVSVLLLVGLTGWVVVRLRETAVLTIPEYYARRYTTGVRVLGGTMMVLAGVLNMGLFLKAGSEFLTAISGLSDDLYLKWIMTGLLCLVLFYTVLGGMVSVVITDLIQFVVLGIGMLIMTGFVVTSVGWGGFEAVVTEANGYFDPTQLTNPSQLGSRAQPIGPLTIVVQTAVIFTAAILWPTGASRTLSVKTPQIAKQLYFYSSIPFLARRAMPVLWGIGAYAFFFHGDGLAMQTDLLAAIDQSQMSTRSAMPLFLAKIIPTGLLGFVTAGMVAAFMSTHDSYLLCWSGVIAQDIVAPCVGEMSDRKRIVVTRISIVSIGAFLLVWGLWYELSGNLWGYMAVTGTIYLAGVFPVVVGGLYWQRASSFGAYCALLAGALGVGGLDPIVRRCQMWISPSIQSGHLTLFAFVAASTVFVIGSLLVPDKYPGITTGRNQVSE
jgi:SSS family solute:Na+ symporter